MLFRYMGLFTIVTSLVWSEGSFLDHTTTEKLVDDTHHTISQTLFEWADILDENISRWMGNDKAKQALIIPDRTPSKPTEKKSMNNIDLFFQNDKYLNETDNTYIRFRIDPSIQSRESNNFNLRLSAQLPFQKSRQSVKFFIEDTTIDDARNLLNNDTQDKENVPDIGIHYFAPESYGIESKYSLGLRGVHPYISARYNIPLHYHMWLIDPVQLFTYSTKYKFEEETNIYFDRELDSSSLLRIQLHRKTQTDEAGMDYGMAIQYYWSPGEKYGLKLSQSFWGNTKYSCDEEETTIQANRTTYGGINNYVTTISWRENLWRDWFFYEIMPSVNFHRKYDYKANYSVRFFIDFYFSQYD